MGIHTGRVRIIVIVCATLLTAASVSVSGMIGWVGLVIPHIARRMVGNDCRVLIPTAGLTGAIFMVLVDDVVTTGTTADSCARLLKQGGASKVTVLCFAVSPSYKAMDTQEENDV